ncbi:NifU family protein [Sneathiella limimaris]|uniref:NifU family protein n=1 Tax=Sneathiella limimaris TaxID=1964213 RepID=UPI00146DDCD8|nr:NifU family protein [Sneathiella limimaris]
MFIQTLPLSDEDKMQFLPGRQVLPSGSVSFADADLAREQSPLASRLFDIPSVKAVELAEDSITITKLSKDEKGAMWIQLKPMVLAAIMDHYMTGMPVLNGPVADAEDQTSYSAEDQKMVDSIKELVEERIRPQLLDDGGDVAFKTYDPSEKTVTLAMDSSGLSTPAFGTQIKIENTLKHFLPEIFRVRFDRMEKESDHDGEDRPGLRTPEAESIRILLETRINPAIAAHGGYISLIDIQEETAYVEMAGGCQGCGMADATLKQGVEVEIKRAVPSIERVLDVTDHAEGTNPYYAGY